jgi:hypothetical protein
MSFLFVLFQTSVFICSDFPERTLHQCEVWSYQCLVAQTLQDRSVEFATEVCMETMPIDFQE